MSCVPASASMPASASVPVPKPPTPNLYQNFQNPIPVCIFLTRLCVAKMPKISDANRKAKPSRAIQLAGLKSSGSGSGHQTTKKTT